MLLIVRTVDNENLTSSNTERSYLLNLTMIIQRNRISQWLVAGLAWLVSCSYGFSNLKIGQIPVVETRSLGNFSILDSTVPFKVILQLDPKNTVPTLDVAVLNRSLLEQITATVDTVKGILRLSYNPQTAQDNLQGFFGNMGGLSGNSAFSVFGSGVVTINGVQVTGGNGAPASSGRDAELTVRTTAVTGLLADGSGDVEVQAPVVVEGGTVTLSVTGSGSMSIPSLTADTLQASITGSGSVKIGGGKVKSANIAAHGTGSFDGEHLLTGSANALASGMGNIVVSVADNLVGSLAGMGSLKYHGAPKVNVQSSGLASAVRLDSS